MGEPKNPQFHDFGILGRVQTPPNQLFLSLETPGHLKKSKRVPKHCQKYDLYKLKKLEIQQFDNFGEKRVPGNDEDPLNNILKNMDMGSISS